MILFAFILFAVLIAGWLAAPSAARESAPSVAPALKMSETPA